MRELAQQLAVEIEFWRDMIGNQPTPCPDESLERMKQALALAEHKLFLLHPEASLELQATQTAQELRTDRRH